MSFVTLMDKVFKDQQGRALSMEPPIRRSKAITKQGSSGGVFSLVGKVITAVLEVLKTPASAFDTRTAFSARVRHSARNALTRTAALD